LEIGERDGRGKGTGREGEQEGKGKEWKGEALPPKWQAWIRHCQSVARNNLHVVMNFRSS